MQISLDDIKGKLVRAGFGRFYPDPPNGPKTSFMTVLCALGENSNNNQFFIYVEHRHHIKELKTLFAPYSNVKVTYSGKVRAL